MMGGNWVIKGPSAIQTCIQLSMNKKMEIVIFKTKIILEDKVLLYTVRSSYTRLSRGQLDFHF